MNNGNYFGMGLSLLIFMLAYFTNQYAALTPLFAYASYGALMIGSIILFYSNFTFDGNVWFRRKMASENVGVMVLIESGKFARFVQVDLGKTELEVQKQIYKPIEENFIFRRGSGVPYLVHIKGKEETVNLLNTTDTASNEVLTSFLKQVMALWKTLAFQQIQQMLIYAIIGLAIVVIAGFALSYYGGIEPTQNMVKAVPAAVKAIITTATPTALPGAPPVV